MGDVVIHATVTKVAGTTETYQVVVLCRLDTFGNYYSLAANSDGTFAIEARYINRNHGLPKPLASTTPTGRFSPYPSVYRITASCKTAPGPNQEVQLMIAANGESATAHDENGLAAGGVGLAVTTPDPPLEIRFDHFRVQG